MIVACVVCNDLHVPSAEAGMPEPGPGLMRGMGFIAHADPGGLVPSDTYVPLYLLFLLFYRSDGEG